MNKHILPIITTLLLTAAVQAGPGQSLQQHMQSLATKEERIAFLKSPSKTSPPPGAAEHVAALWHDKDGNGWNDVWEWIFPELQSRDVNYDADGDGMTCYEEMLQGMTPLHKVLPRMKPVKEWTAKERQDAEWAAALAREREQQRMAARRVELKQFEAGEVGRLTRGTVRLGNTVAEEYAARMNLFRQKVHQERPKRALALQKAKNFLREKGIPERIGTEQGKAPIFAGADSEGRPVFYVTHNITAAKSIQTNKLNLPTGSGGLGLNLTGAGVILGHWDGADAQFEHQELGNGTRIFDQDVSGAGLNSMTRERIHATHTAGTMIGLGLNAAISGHAAGDSIGMATGAVLKSWDSFEDIKEMDDHFADDPPAQHVLVSNHSYGLQVGWDGAINNIPVWQRTNEHPEATDQFLNFGAYTPTSGLLDEHIFSVRYHLPVYAAGNHRYQYGDPVPLDKFYIRDVNGLELYTRTKITPPSGVFYYLWLGQNGSQWGSIDDPSPGFDGAERGGYRTIGQEVSSKNVLSVGSCADLPNGYQGPDSVSVSFFSSCGPTKDGRLKPDVVSNGEGLYSAAYGGEDSQGDPIIDQYVSQSGTSMAAPGVSGSLALLIQHYRNHYGAGAKLWASTLKALVIHTVDEVDSDGNANTYYDGPDYRAGWGLANFKRAAELISTDGAPGAQGGPRHSLIREINYDVLGIPTLEIPVKAVGGEPLRVTICWSDPKDLEYSYPEPRPSNWFDLQVVAPGGALKYPWVLNPSAPASPAVQGNGLLEEPDDVVKQVLIESPTAGATYIIKLDGCCFSEENNNLSAYAPVSVIVSGVVPEVDDLKITNVEKVSSGGIYSLGWQSNLGEVYRIETSTDLINWARAKDENDDDLPDLFPQGMFSTKEVNTQVTDETRRFWRVRAVQPWESAP
jgi:hypothetical protein